ncbi:MAG: hypothetical protein U9N87_14685, partial [Planctomycetota bacterium]|nr:hypothetical protein [Planctomycetota bacterium]
PADSLIPLPKMPCQLQTARCARYHTPPHFAIAPFGGVSYNPATMRGFLNQFHSYLLVENSR